MKGITESEPRPGSVVQSTAKTKSLASAVVLSFRRKFNLPQIVDSLLNTVGVDDVVIWHNDEEEPLTVEDLFGVFADDTFSARYGELVGTDRLRIVNAASNQYTWGRFLAVKHCKHSTIITCDDDQQHRFWLALLELYRKTPSSVHATLEPEHFRDRASHKYGELHDVQLGFGSVFDKRCLNVFDEYLKEFDVDYVLRRKADRIFALLQRRRHEINDLGVSPLKGSDGRMSLHKLSDSNVLRVEARKRCIIVRMHKEFSVMKQRDARSAAQSYRLLADRYGWEPGDVKSAINRWYHNILNNEFGSWQNTEST
jgi:hypothetical protein